MKGLFLDMDHTVIKPKSGETFPKDKDDWEFIPGALDTIKLFVKQGYLPILVTNQGGIGTYQTEEEVISKLETITKQMEDFLDIPDVPYYYSKTRNPDDPMRKPNTGMQEAASKDHNVDPAQSVMVGDMQSDLDFANNAGIPKFIWAKDFPTN